MRSKALLVCRIEKKRGHIYVNALAGPPVDMLTNSCSSHIVVLYKLFIFFPSTSSLKIYSWYAVSKTIRTNLVYLIHNNLKVLA